jgi:hypothetical protein
MVTLWAGLQAHFSKSTSSILGSSAVAFRRQSTLASGGTIQIIDPLTQQAVA